MKVKAKTFRRKINEQVQWGVGIDFEDPKKKLEIRKYINLKLASMNLPIYEKLHEQQELELAHELIQGIREKNRILHHYMCPSDYRIQSFINRYFADFPQNSIPIIPNQTYNLDRFGEAREISFSPDSNEFNSSSLKSYKLVNGVLHNPKCDVRTTLGSFHICEGGLPIPYDKKGVPKAVFLNILKAAFNPPEEDLIIPFTSTQEKKAKSFVSILLKPKICPQVPGYMHEKDMECRVFVPGNYASNLDFIENVFGNWGNPFLSENDSLLDPYHFSGVTGAIIQCPHLNGSLNKKALGLPHKSEATPRQIRDKMYWENEFDIYNEGNSFKLCCRDSSGVIITIIADNYFGYTKKEVKTQMTYATNIYGLTEEEHAGGALIIPRKNLGNYFEPDSSIKDYNLTFEHTIKTLGDRIIVHSTEGYAVDKQYPNIKYIPLNTIFDINAQIVKWEKNGQLITQKLLQDNVYIYPTGLKVTLELNKYSKEWTLVGTYAKPILFHKPCTVSGGGKSELSKPIQDAMDYGPIFTANYSSDMKIVADIINKVDWGLRFKNPWPDHVSRSILSLERSLGSVIKLLTPQKEYSEEYIDWLKSIPKNIKGLVLVVKRFYKKEWGTDWLKHFSVDKVNNEDSYELRLEGKKLFGYYLRVGINEEQRQNICKLRLDYLPSKKIQWEDDISASCVVPTSQLEHYKQCPKYSRSVKFVENCENRLFQRPDDAIIRGYDKITEKDMSQKANFIANFEPLTVKDAKKIYDQSISFSQFTEPMQTLVKEFMQTGKENEFFVCSSELRIVGKQGQRTKNPRYLQLRPDFAQDFDKYVTDIGIRLLRKLDFSKSVYLHVNFTIPGRLNNPADKEAGYPPLSVYNPIHYQELPELLMDFISSLTGRSPSTSGAGSEGALTKGPFNSLVATTDLNNTLVSFILTGYDGFSTAAGFIGHKFKVSHDISLLVPELFSLMTEEERNAKNLIDGGFLDKVEDFVYEWEEKGEKKKETILASRLGYRINENFVNVYFGKVFENPITVFEDEILHPEKQSLQNYVAGLRNITYSQKKIAQEYLDDGSVQGFIPPLEALIHIMAKGNFNGKTINDPEIRRMFTYEYVINSDWYYKRLVRRQQQQLTINQRQLDYLKKFRDDQFNKVICEELQIDKKIQQCERDLDWIASSDYIPSIMGTIGLDEVWGFDDSKLKKSSKS